MEADVEAAVAPVLERHERALAAQQAFVSRLRLLSPAMTVREALDDAAGTGLARHRAFFDQAWAFAEATKAFFAPRVYRQERLVEADYDAIPRFAFVEERAGEAARRVLGGLLFVAGVTLLFGWLGLRALARYPVAG
jgi:ABC-2 type transport system permease protein